MPPKVMRRKVVRRGRRKVMRRRPLGRAMIKRKSDYATLVETRENQLTLNNNGTYAFNFTTSLSEFQRAQEVAHAYKYYRAAKVELTFIPYANVASVNGAPALRLPQLYFTVDRVANQWIVPTEDELQERGVAPKVFNRKYKFSWKPSLLQNIQMETFSVPPLESPNLAVINAINSVPLFNKWLPTQQSYGFAPGIAPRPMIGENVVQPSANPYALRYYGAAFVIDQEGGNQEFVVGDLLTKVTWEFKGPRALKTNQPDKQLIVSYDTSMTNPTVTAANQQPTEYPPP